MLNEKDNRECMNRIRTEHPGENTCNEKIKNERIKRIDESHS